MDPDGVPTRCFSCRPFLDARDAYLAADLLRFGGANQDLLWLIGTLLPPRDNQVVAAELELHSSMPRVNGAQIVE